MSISPVCSQLAEFLKIPHVPVPQKKTKTGQTCVLTSSEAWAIMREEELRKPQEAEEKEKKIEREGKRKLREEEKRQKDEQREAKRKEMEETKARKELERLHTQEERSKKAAMKRQVTHVSEQNNRNSSDEGGRLAKESRFYCNEHY